MISNDWMVGFTDGNGYFNVSVFEDKNTKYGINILPEFLIISDFSNIKLLMKIKEFFQCGVVRCSKKHGLNIYCYRVRSIVHANNIILPFFDRNNLLSMKFLDYKRYSYVVKNLSIKDFNKDNLVKILEYLNCKIKIKSET